MNISTIVDAVLYRNYYVNMLPLACAVQCTLCVIKRVYGPIQTSTAITLGQVGVKSLV